MLTMCQDCSRTLHILTQSSKKKKKKKTIYGKGTIITTFLPMRKVRPIEVKVILFQVTQPVNCGREIGTQVAWL